MHILKDVLGKKIAYCTESKRYNMNDIYREFFLTLDRTTIAPSKIISKSKRPKLDTGFSYYVEKELEKQDIKTEYINFSGTVFVSSSILMVPAEFCSLYVKHCFGDDHPLVKYFGDYDYFPFDYELINGVRVRILNGLYSTYDICKAYNIDLMKQKRYLKGKMKVYGTDDIQTARSFNDSETTLRDLLFFVSPAVLVPFVQIYAPSEYVNFSKSFDKNHMKKVQVIRREYSFGSDIVHNLFSDYEIIPQYSVFDGKYRIDWYVPELKIAIEFDEENHSRSDVYINEKDRQAEIEKELGCRFIRYTV